MTKEIETNQEFLLYKNANDEIKIQVLLINNDIWLTQSLMADLFDTTKRNIGLHLQNIYKDNELCEKATKKDCFLVRKEGSREVKRTVKVYNLEAIISVGFMRKTISFF